jgi:hypothetical protein
MKSQIRQMINSVFKQIGDLKVDAVLKHETGSVFDASEGEHVKTYSETPVEVFINSFDSKAVDNLIINFDDKKVLLPASQIDFTPKAGKDYLIIDGTSHGIEMVQSKFGELFILKI